MRVVLINILILAAIFAVLEAATRLLAPEYAGAYFSPDVTHGNPIYRNRIWGHRVKEGDVNDRFGRRGNEKRVLFIGDSVTFGYGVTVPETYYSIAELLSGAECETVISGAGRYYTNLEQLLNSDLRPFILNGFDPDIVIYQFNVNDLDPSGPPRKTENDRLTARERFEKVRLTYLNRSAFFKWFQSVAMRIYQRGQRARLLDSLRYSELPDPQEYNALWSHFEQVLVETKDLLASRGIDFGILLVAESFRISDREIDNDFGVDTSGVKVWPGEKVATIAARYGIRVYDSLPHLQKFRRQDPTTRLYFPNDQNHPNSTGHKIIGEAAAAMLEEKFGLCTTVAPVDRDGALPGRP